MLPDLRRRRLLPVRSERNRRSCLPKDLSRVRFSSLRKGPVRGSGPRMGEQSARIRESGPRNGGTCFVVVLWEVAEVEESLLCDVVGPVGS